jgi:GrpB-like predicted nucleotidyltransferase (UPF0157 family)
MKRPKELPMKTEPANNSPLSEEQIRARTVGESEPFSGKVQIVNYDREWPNLFTHEAERVRNAPGPRALQIEHTGSTSVPGLAAKPIINMLLVVSDSADEEAYLPDLERAGYSRR